MSYPLEYDSKVAIDLPSDDEVRKVIGKNYDPAKVLNIMKMLAGTGESMYSAGVGMVKAIFQAEGISPEIREMIILRAAKILNSPYEWQANVVMAKNVGLTPEEIEAAASDGPVSGINPEYVLICEATDQLSKEGTLKDETLTALLGRYGNTVSRRLILMISWFNMLSLFINGCRVPLETTDKIGNKTSPLG